MGYVEVERFFLFTLPRGSGGMADALVLGASLLQVWVQVPSSAPFKTRMNLLFVRVFCCLKTHKIQTLFLFP